MPVNVPKKFYRNVFRGVTYFTQGQKRPCKLGELVAYVYLKNGRALPANRVETIVKEALTDLCSSGVIKKNRNCYQLTEVLAGSLRDVPIAGPSGASNTATGRRSVSGTRRTKTPTKRSNRAQRAGPVDADGPETEMMSDDESANDDGDEQRADDQQQSESEPFLHRPLKMEHDHSNEGDEDIGSGSNTTTGNGSEQQPPNNSWFSWLNIW